MQNKHSLCCQRVFEYSRGRTKTEGLRCPDENFSRSNRRKSHDVGNEHNWFWHVSLQIRTQQTGGRLASGGLFSSQTKPDAVYNGRVF